MDDLVNTNSDTFSEISKIKENYNNNISDLKNINKFMKLAESTESVLIQQIKQHLDILKLLNNNLNENVNLFNKICSNISPK